MTGPGIFSRLQQPVRVDAVPPVGRHGRSPPEVASAGALASAAAPPLLACPVGPFARSVGAAAGAARPSRATLPPTCSAGPVVVQAVGAPVAVQFRGGHAPHPPLLGVGGDGAEFSQQPARRVQGQGALVNPPPPGILPGHRPLPDPQVGVVGFHPAQMPLLHPAQDAEPLGGLVGLSAGGLERVLGQHQPLPGRGQLPPPRQPLARAAACTAAAWWSARACWQACSASPARRVASCRSRERSGGHGARSWASRSRSARSALVDSRRTSSTSGVSVARVLLPSRVSTRASSSSGARPPGPGCGRSSSGPRGSGPTVRYRSVRCLPRVSCT